MTHSNRSEHGVSAPPRRFGFGAYTLDLDAHELRRGDSPVELSGKGLALLMLDGSLQECIDVALDRVAAALPRIDVSDEEISAHRDVLLRLFSGLLRATGMRIV